MLVHDPARTSAFARIASLEPGALADRYLFRDHPNRAAFSREHAALARAIRDAGVEVVELRESLAARHRRELDDNPNYVYTRDPAITVPWLPGSFIRGAMRKPVRRKEPDALAAALRALGLRELFAMPADVFLEGGDVIPLVLSGRRTLLVGFGPRTSYAALAVLREQLLPWAVDELVGIELVPERMNLDGALVPVADDTFVIEPSSIVRAFVVEREDEHAVDLGDLLHDAGMTAVEVTRAEAAAAQACNLVCLGARHVVSYDLCSRVVAQLRQRNMDVRTIPATELIKGTGGPRCMTRPLYC
jgi:N-dimethylarginine dimethylaminohydrolase